MRKTITMGIVLLLVLITLATWTPIVIAEEYECPTCGTSVTYGQEECEVCGEILEWDDIEATVDIDPDTLNLKSKGKWITCLIDPLLRNATDIDPSTVKIAGIGGVPVDIPASDFPVGVKDFDADGIPELMVKFDRSEVQDAITTTGPVTLTIRGFLTTGGNIEFSGSDNITVK